MRAALIRATPRTTRAPASAEARIHPLLDEDSMEKKKLRLKMDALEVQGFATADAPAGGGTVRGAENSGWNELSCMPETCWGTSCDVRCESHEVMTPCC